MDAVTATVEPHLEIPGIALLGVELPPDHADGRSPTIAMGASLGAGTPDGTVIPDAIAGMTDDVAILD
jgi:hypothetical protein